MAQGDSFDELLVRLRSGDQQAAQEVFVRYGYRLIALAQGRLSSRIRQKVDPEDVVQSVFRSFFDRQADGQYDLANWDGMWSLLVMMTLHKCGHQVEHFLAARRGIHREASAISDESSAVWETISREPTPSQAAILSETIEQLMQSLNPREQQMLSLRLQGHSASEISVQVGRTERTVERLLQRLRSHLLHMEGAETTPTAGR